MYAGQMVEGGPTEEVIQKPRHPYSQLLLSAAPDPDTMGHRKAVEDAFERRTGAKAQGSTGQGNYHRTRRTAKSDQSTSWVSISSTLSACYACM